MTIAPVATRSTANTIAAQVNNALIGAAARHPFVRFALAHLPRWARHVAERAGRHHVWDITGPNFFSSAVEAWNHRCHDRDDDEEDARRAATAPVAPSSYSPRWRVVVHPPSVFYPVHFGTYAAKATSTREDAATSASTTPSAASVATNVATTATGPPVAVSGRAEEATKKAATVGGAFTRHHWHSLSRHLSMTCHMRISPLHHSEHHCRRSLSSGARGARPSLALSAPRDGGVLTGQLSDVVATLRAGVDGANGTRHLPRAWVACLIFSRAPPAGTAALRAGADGGGPTMARAGDTAAEWRAAWRCCCRNYTHDDTNGGPSAADDDAANPLLRGDAPFASLSSSSSSSSSVVEMRWDARALMAARLDGDTDEDDSGGGASRRSSQQWRRQRVTLRIDVFDLAGVYVAEPLTAQAGGITQYACSSA